jgi:hypothetical protein
MDTSNCVKTASGIWLPPGVTEEDLKPQPSFIYGWYAYSVTGMARINAVAPPPPQREQTAQGS